MGPCTAPALAVILGYAATRRNMVFAASLLLSLRWNGDPLILIALLPVFWPASQIRPMDGPGQSRLWLDLLGTASIPDQRGNSLV